VQVVPIPSVKSLFGIGPIARVGATSSSSVKGGAKSVRPVSVFKYFNPGQNLDPFLCVVYRSRLLPQLNKNAILRGKNGVGRMVDSVHV